MCRSRAEGGRRCDGTCTDERRAEIRELARLNRAKSRKQRRMMADTAGDLFGEQARAAIMHARPSELALIASQVQQYDPEAAQIMVEAAGGDLPGTHNMVVSEVRDERARAMSDRDADGDMRTDPHRVSQAMVSLAQIEHSYAHSERAAKALPPARLREIQREADLRHKAASLGLYKPGLSPEDMTADQLRFYQSHSPQQIAALGGSENAVVREFCDYAMNNTTFKPSVRPHRVPQKHLNATPDALSRTAVFQDKGYYPVRSGVHLMRNPNAGKSPHEPEFIYRVDGKIDLPANGSRAAVAESSKIIGVSDIAFDADDAPQGQSSLYARLMSEDTDIGRSTRAQMKEDLIRSVYAGGRAPGVDQADLTDAEGRTYSLQRLDKALGSLQYVRPGKSKRVTVDTLVATAQSSGLSMSNSPANTAIAQQQLDRAAEVEKYLSGVRLRHFGIKDGHTVSGKRLPKTRKGSQRSVANFVTTADGRRDEHKAVMSGLARINERSKGKIPGNSRSLTPSPVAESTILRKNMEVTSSDVDEMVAQLNASRAATTPDRVDDKTKAAGADIARLVERGTTANKVARKRGDAGADKPVTVTSRSPLSKSVNASHDFVVGRSFSPTEYVSAHAGSSKKADPADGRSVRVVYTTAQATAVTSDRAVIGPESKFRILKTDTSNPNEVVVHVVDEDAALDAATA